MIKRLFVTCDFPPVSGGQSNYFRNLWSRISASDDTLLIPDRSKNYCESNHIGNTRFTRLPRGEWLLPRLGRLLGLIVAMTAAVRATKPGVIHAGQIMACGLAALWCKKTLRIPYYVYVFGADIMEFENDPLGRWLITMVLNNSTGVICCSNFTAQHVVDKFAPSAAVHTINPGVEDRFFEEKNPGALRQKLGLAGKTVLLTVGRLIERKGHELVIRSLKKLIELVPDVHYLVVGDGPVREKLEKTAAQCGVSNLVSFTGSVGDAVLPSYYHAADLFIMVPRQLGTKDIEGFGIVYLEANAAGLPVITNPALLEIMEECYCKANWVRVCTQELSTQKNVDNSATDSNWGDYTDTKLPFYDNVIEEIDAVVKKVDPAFVFVHHGKDTHQDHRYVSECAVVATRKVKECAVF
jgi:phosphatidylinositol alpha-1,6-mannosyltransferase